MQSVRGFQSLRLLYNRIGMHYSHLTSLGSVPLDKLPVVTTTCREHAQTSMVSINQKASMSKDSNPKGPKVSKNKDSGSTNTRDQKVKDSVPKKLSTINVVASNVKVVGPKASEVKSSGTMNVVASKAKDSGPKASEVKGSGTMNEVASKAKDSIPKISEGKGPGTMNVVASKAKDSGPKAPEVKRSGTMNVVASKAKDSDSKALKGGDPKSADKEIGPEGKNLDPPQDIFQSPRPAVLGPGASKDGKFKDTEYFSYKPFSYYQMEIVMAKLRVPQPVAIPKKKEDSGRETAAATEAVKVADGTKAKSA